MRYLDGALDFVVYTWAIIAVVVIASMTPHAEHKQGTADTLIKIECQAVMGKRPYTLTDECYIRRN